MEKMMKGMSKGKMPALPGLEGAAANGPSPGLTARPGSSSRKKKRKKSRR
jgi:hypothetical protein